MHIPQMLQRLQTDNISGATTLVELALDILEAFTTQEASQTPHEFVTALETLVDTVLAAQPSMAVMINLAQQALQAGPANLPLMTVRQQLQQTLTAFRRDLRARPAFSTRKFQASAALSRVLISTMLLYLLLSFVLQL